MKSTLIAFIAGAVVLLAATAHALEVSVTDARFKSGEPGSVTVKFKKNPLKDVFAIDVVFDFDSKAFRLDRIEKGPDVSGFQLVENRNLGPGRVKVALIGLFPLNAKSGELLNLHFTPHVEAKRARENALDITHVLFSTDTNALEPEKITQGDLILSR